MMKSICFFLSFCTFEIGVLANNISPNFLVVKPTSAIHSDSSHQNAFCIFAVDALGSYVPTSINAYSESFLSHKIFGYKFVALNPTLSFLSVSSFSVLSFIMILELTRNYEPLGGGFNYSEVPFFSKQNHTYQKLSPLEASILIGGLAGLGVSILGTLSVESLEKSLLKKLVSEEHPIWTKNEHHTLFNHLKNLTPDTQIPCDTEFIPHNEN